MNATKQQLAELDGDVRLEHDNTWPRDPRDRYRTPMRGTILYQGPSQLDGETPIVVVITGLHRPSANQKTGGIPQVFILLQNMHPVEAVKTGADGGVCGDCPFASGNGCYVKTFHGPRAVWQAWCDKAYTSTTTPQLSARLDAVKARSVRIGAYGDPAAVPVRVWDRLQAAAGGRRLIGYTHQWRTCDIGLSRYCMASTETEADTAHAWDAGWRTFRVRRPTEAVLPGEFVCPASEEGGKRKTCADCRACDGMQRGGARPSAVIIAHGNVAKRAAEAIKRLLQHKP